MNFFILNKEDFTIDYNPELVFVAPFKKLIQRDRSKYKTKAKAELAYIYFFCDFKSPYKTELDEDTRKQQIVEVLEDLPKDWKEDKLVKEAMDYYMTNSKTIASMALDVQRDNVNKLLTKIGNFIDSDDVSDVQKAVAISEKIEGLINSIDKLEKMVKGERESDNRHQGKQSKSMFEDGVI